MQLRSISVSVIRQVVAAQRLLQCSAPAALLLTLVASAFPQSPPADPVSAIRVNVNRVDVGVIVTDSEGRFIEGLQRSDFRVFDNGVEQLLTDFAPSSEPAKVLFVIEAGPAVYLLEGGHLAAAYSLLDGLAPGDQVAIAKYSASLDGILNFTPDKRLVASALGDLHFNIGFGSLNLSTSLGQALASLENVPGKKAIILLSTGVDTSPAAQAQAIAERLRTGGVRLLAVSLNGELRSSGVNQKKKASGGHHSLTEEQFEQADNLLRSLAESAGGRAYFPRNAREFHAAYAEIAQVIRHEYSLAFAPPARDGAIHTIEVRMATRDSIVGESARAPQISHRRAYLAPAAAN